MKDFRIFALTKGGSTGGTCHVIISGKEYQLAMAENVEDVTTFVKLVLDTTSDDSTVDFDVRAGHGVLGVKGGDFVIAIIGGETIKTETAAGEGKKLTDFVSELTRVAKAQVAQQGEGLACGV